MKKKVVVLLLSLCLTFAFTACGSEADDRSDDKQTEKDADEDKDDSEDKGDSEDKSDDANADSKDDTKIDTSEVKDVSEMTEDEKYDMKVKISEDTQRLDMIRTAFITAAMDPEVVNDSEYEMITDEFEMKLEDALDKCGAKFTEQFLYYLNVSSVEEYLSQFNFKGDVIIKIADNRPAAYIDGATDLDGKIINVGL